MKSTCTAALFRVAASLATLVLTATAGAGGPATGPPGALSWSDALQTTVRTGRPTLLVVTAPEEPASLRLLDALGAPATARQLDSSVVVASLRAEVEPDPVRRMRITTFPTLMVFRRGARGIEWVATRDGLTTVSEVTEWLRGLDLIAAERAVDRAVQPAGWLKGKHANAQASPQSCPPPAHKVSPPAPAPVPVVTMQPVAAPLVVAPPSPPIVIQQRPPTIVLAPAPPPVVYYASPPGVAAQPPAQQNLFLSTPPAPTPSAQGVPGIAGPLEPVWTTFAAPVPAGATAPPAAGPMALVLTNPNVLGRTIGAIGRKLATFGNPRVQVGGLTGLAPIATQLPAVAPPPVYGFPATAIPTPSGQSTGLQPTYFGQPPAALPLPVPTTADPAVVTR